MDQPSPALRSHPPLYAVVPLSSDCQEHARSISKLSERLCYKALPEYRLARRGLCWGPALQLLFLTIGLSGCVSVTSSTQTSGTKTNTPAATIANQPDQIPVKKTESPTNTPESSLIDGPGGGDQTVNDAHKGRTNAPATSVAPARQLAPSVSIDSTRQTGRLDHPQLTELSGLSSSQTTPGLLFAINDSGSPPIVYALSETGEYLDEWTIDARNRDWEDLASTVIDDIHYLVIGDIGDNLNTHKHSRLLFVPETLLRPSNDTPISPAFEIAFTYEDGPRNVEAFAIHENKVFLISKERVSQSGPTPSHLYELQIPDIPTTAPQIAAKVATLPLTRASFESRMVAAITGVDLNHPTSLDFDTTRQTAYLLTYRHVLELKKRQGQSWRDALSDKPTRLHAHRLQQAEALTVTPGRAIWFSSEGAMAPLWAIPIDSPL